MWNKPHTMGFYPPLCVLLQHTNQSILLFLTWLFQWSVFSPLNTQHCVRAQLRAMVSMTFSLQGRHRASKSWAGVTWPVETQAAGVEKLKLKDSRLIPFPPDAHVGLRPQVSISQNHLSLVVQVSDRHVFAHGHSTTISSPKIHSFFKKGLTKQL